MHTCLTFLLNKQCAGAYTRSGSPTGPLPEGKVDSRLQREAENRWGALGKWQGQLIILSQLMMGLHFHSFSDFFIDLKMFLFLVLKIKRVTERDGSPPVQFPVAAAARTEPNWSQSWELHSGLSHGCRGPSTWTILYCFSRPLAGSCIGSEVGGTWMHACTGCWSHNQ